MFMNSQAELQILMVMISFQHACACIICTLQFGLAFVGMFQPPPPPRDPDRRRPRNDYDAYDSSYKRSRYG